jgi:hypothetical protein
MRDDDAAAFGDAGRRRAERGGAGVTRLGDDNLIKSLARSAGAGDTGRPPDGEAEAMQRAAEGQGRLALLERA